MDVNADGFVSQNVETANVPQGKREEGYYGDDINY